MLDCYSVVAVADTGVEVKDEEQLRSFKSDDLIRLIQRADHSLQRGKHRSSNTLPTSEDKAHMATLITQHYCYTTCGADTSFIIDNEHLPTD